MNHYNFDAVLDQSATNTDSYNSSMPALVDVSLKGRTATIMAFGVTGSGKTHTMSGSQKQPGLIRLTIEQLFNEVKYKEDDQTRITIVMSYFQIYNEQIKDLLN